MPGWGGGGGSYNNIRGGPEGYLFQFRINYSALFSTFDMDKLKKPMERTEHLLEKLPSLKVGFVEN